MQLKVRNMPIDIQERSPKQLVGNIAAIALPVLAGVFCCFYLFSTHDALAKWYCRLNGCFYRNAVWSTTFFTDQVKQAGNGYAVGGIVAAGLLIAYHVYSWRRPIPYEAGYRVIGPGDFFFVVVLAVCCHHYWARGAGLALPAYDEVFSAQNAVGIHPFQTLSYYMLPNNHLLFNFLNNVLFHFAPDKVVTGRLISGWCYFGFGLLMYGWLKELMRSKWCALFCTFPLLFQIIIWGFGFQARGYEPYLLCEAVCMVCTFRYFRQGGHHWLRLNLWATVLGYLCMPSFLYLHVAQLAFALLGDISRRRPDFLFWKYQLLAAMVTFITYLPVLCFSGLASITANQYVLPVHAFKDKTRWDFLVWLPGYVKPYLDHIFHAPQIFGHDAGLPMLCAPFLLLLDRRNPLFRDFGRFYLCMWGAALALTTVMIRPPYERNMILQYGVSVLGVLLLTFRLLQELKRYAFPALPSVTATMCIGAAFALHFKHTDDALLVNTLYEYEVNHCYEAINQGLNAIPSGASVAFTDEGFYCRYIAGKKGFQTDKCTAFNTAYLVKQEQEPLPKEAEGKYTLLSKGAEYEIYKRN